MPKEMEQKAAALLRSCGLKKTRPRVAILSVLLKADGPRTQEQLSYRLGAGAPNKTTIYRTLMLLLEHNLIHQAYIKGRSRYFEPAHHCRADQCHPHFTCTQCGQTHCFYDAVIPAVQNIPAGFQVHHRQLRLEGICKFCRSDSDQGKVHEK